jgi:hypothetical protein
MQLNWQKRLFIQLILEVLMVMTPISFDFLGAAGEYLLHAGREQIELAA